MVGGATPEAKPEPPLPPETPLTPDPNPPGPAFCDEPPRPDTSVCIIRPDFGGGFCNVDPPTGDMLDPPECFPAESTPEPAFCDEPPRPGTSVCIIRPEFGGGFCNVDPPTGDMLDPPECFPAESTPEPAFCDEPPRPGTSVCIIRPEFGGGFCNVDPRTGDMLDPPECFPAESKKQQPAAGGGCRGECNLGPIPHPTVRRGSKGASVGELQEKLNTVIVVGAPLVVDCDFGPRTDDAVRQFQANEGLDADGIVGPKTWDTLDRLAVRPQCGV